MKNKQFNLSNPIFFIFIMLFSMVFSALLTNENIPDFSNYHYYNAWAFLNHQTVSAVPAASLNTFFNPLLDIPLYFYIQFFNDHVLFIHALQGIWTGLFLFVLYKINTLILKNTKKPLLYNIIVLLIALTAQATYTQIGSSTNEVTVAFLILWSVYILFKVLFSNSQKLISFVFAGYILGCALGAKPTCLPYCIATGLWLMILHKNFKKPALSVFVFALSGFAGYLTVNGYFMYLYYKAFANPFAPMFNNIFHSPYFFDWDYRDARFTPSLKTFFIYPYLWNIHPLTIAEIPYRDIRLALYYTLCLILSVCFLKNRKKTTNLSRETYFLYWLVFLNFVLWMAMFSILRYAVPVEALGTLLFVKYLTESPLFRRFYMRLMFYVIFIALVICPVFYLKWGTTTSSQKIQIEKLTLPDNSLVKIYGIFSSFLIPELKKNPSCTVTTHYSNYKAVQFNGQYLLMKGYDFVEQGPFLEKRNAIENAHKGPVIYIINSWFFQTSLEELQKARQQFIEQCELYTQTHATTKEYEEYRQNCLQFSEQLYNKEYVMTSSEGYYCRPLQNNLTYSLKICVPNNLKNVILASD